MLLKRPKQHHYGVFESSGEKVAETDLHECTRLAGVWAEPQGGLEMANCEFGLPCPRLVPTTGHPAASAAWVGGQRTVDQSYGGMNVLGEGCGSGGRPAEDTRVVTGDPKRMTGESDPRAAA